MSVSTENFVHKPIRVGAIRVTQENMEAVASWVHGQIKGEHDSFSSPYIDMVTVDHLLNPSRVRVFIGDWIVSKRDSMLVFKDLSFRENFESAGVDKTEEVVKLVLMAMGGALSDPQAVDHIARRTARTIAQLFR